MRVRILCGRLWICRRMRHGMISSHGTQEHIRRLYSQDEPGRFSAPHGRADPEQRERMPGNEISVGRRPSGSRLQRSGDLTVVRRLRRVETPELPSQLLHQFVGGAQFTYWLLRGSEMAHDFVNCQKIETTAYVVWRDGVLKLGRTRVVEVRHEIVAALLRGR
jgi:hypothetical protein